MTSEEYLVNISSEECLYNVPTPKIRGSPNIGFNHSHPGLRPDLEKVGGLLSHVGWGGRSEEV